MIGNKTVLRTGALLMAAALLTACGAHSPRVTPATPQAIRQRIEASKAPLTIVHVWATWCEPCREEFPDVMKVSERYEESGVRLILVSADEPSETGLVEEFLTEHMSPVGSLITTELSEAFIETLSPEWGGSLPASFFYKDGRLLKEWEGIRSYERYAETIETLLGKGREKN